MEEKRQTCFSAQCRASGRFGVFPKLQFMNSFMLLDGVCCAVPQLRVILKRIESFSTTCSLQYLINHIQTLSDTFLSPVLKNVGQWGVQSSICSSAWGNHGPGKCSPVSDLNVSCTLCHTLSRQDKLKTSSEQPFSGWHVPTSCLLYTSPSPRDRTRSRMPSSA